MREALDKARPLITAIGARLQDRAPRLRARPGLPRALADGRRRPDPGAGVIETLAVDSGEPVELERHLARLTASARAVLGSGPPADLAARVTAAAREAAPGRHRLRIDVTAEGTALALRPAAPPAREPVALTPVLLPGGLGEHKWRDRTLVEALAAELGALPLLVDADGAVLEAAHANVFLVEGEQLVTPPADGRLLAGVTRARVLAATGTGAVEEPIDLPRLAAADAVLLTSSIALVRARRRQPSPAAGPADRRPASRPALQSAR